MQFRFGCKACFFAVALLLSCAAAAFDETPVSGVAPATTIVQAEPPEQVVPSEYDFNVVTATKDETHPFYDKGSKVGFVVNGVQGRTLILVRGKAYTFGINTPVMHDFYLSTSPVGWGTGTLTEGVAGNFTYKGVVTFRPTEETPDLVYYACRNHQYMGGTIHIVNAGEEDGEKDKFKEAQATPAAAPKKRPAPDKNELQQKLSFAGMSINGSEAAKRISESSNEVAKAKYKDAQDKLAAANTAFDVGDMQEAKARFDEAMGLMAEATKLVPSEVMQQRAKAKIEELAQGLLTMEESFKQNYDELKKSGVKNLPTLNSDTIHKMVDSARALAAQGLFDEANKILSGATREVTNTLNNLLSSKTMSYEMQFASPDKEYAYELERFNSLEALIPQAVEQRQPAETTVALMEAYVKKGKESRDQASADAQQKNFAAALENIKNGTKQMETALKLIGIN
jgi:tetratricopeptide (TPR) repeat protein